MLLPVYSGQEKKFFFAKRDNQNFLQKSRQMYNILQDIVSQYGSLHGRAQTFRHFVQTYIL